jgi:hypothetical protein
MNLSCSFISVEKFLDYNFDAIEITNLSVKNHSGALENFSGKFYLFASYAAYGHSLMDVYAQYKILKKKYSDLRVIFYEDSSKGLHFNNNLVASDYMKILNYNKNNIIDISKDNLFFEKIILFFDMNNSFPEEFYSKNGLKRSPHYFPFCDCYLGIDPCGESEYFKYNYMAIDTLRDDFSEFFSDSPNDKIFISRKKYNDEYKNEILKYSTKQIFSDEEAYWYRRAKIRHFEYEDQVIDLFKEAGYKIIAPETYGLIDQIKIFSAAHQIVSVSGTGLFNTFWSASDTAIFEIRAVSDFKYHYKEFSEHVGREHHVIDVVGLPLESLLEKIKNDIILKRN